MANNTPSLNIEMLQRFIPFDELSVSTLNDLLPHFRYYEVEPRKILFKRGQTDEECHFLLAGTVDLANEQFNITQVSGDDAENFLALDASHAIHRHTGVTQTSCQLFAIKRHALDLITTWAELSLSWQQPSEPADWLEALLTSNLFNRVPAANIQKLIACFQPREVQLGEVIIKQGDEGNECYVIKQGNVLVTRLDNGKQETLAGLTNGELFGEDALISNEPRNATITMSSDGVLMVISKDEFEVLLKQPTINYIDDSELATLISEGDTATIILDVRQNIEAESNPVYRARNIPLAQLRSRLNELAPEFTYVTLGEARAEAAAYILHEAGYNVRVLKRES